MAEEKRRFKATIAGRTYTIVAKKPVEHLKTVSELANERILQLKSAMPALDIEQRSILVAVNAISETIGKQAEIDELKEKISSLEKELKKEAQTEATQPKVEEQENPVAKTAKEATSRFVRPVTASQRRLQKESQQQLASQNTPATTKKKSTIKQNQGKTPSGNR